MSGRPGDLQSLVCPANENFYKFSLAFPSGARDLICSSSCDEIDMLDGFRYEHGQDKNQRLQLACKTPS